MAAVDRNLLYGVLAVQLGFVTRDQLIAATSRWVLNKDQPLGEIFIRQGMISRAEGQIIDGVVEKQLERNGSDAQSLQELESLGELRETLKQLGDSTLERSRELDTVGSATPDAFSTLVGSQPTIGETKNRYTILRVHQKGGLGCVSIARDEELNREIALKEILPSHADNAENRTRFIREAEITGALEHPCVVPVYSLGEFADGRPYYAMRFIRGENLHAAIEDYHNSHAPRAERQLAFRQLLSKIVDVCHAVEYAHSRGVIHRDIKPGNIMLGDYGETLLVDWGLAKTLGEDFGADETTVPRVATTERASSTHTQMGRVVGTPSFMSPEQAAGRLHLMDATSDVYSLGATLYQLLAGTPAFQGTEEEVLGNVQLGRFQLPREVDSSVPRPLEAICVKAMARIPDERYQSARDMADDLERYLGDARVLAYREPFTAVLGRWMRHHRTLVLSTAAALTVAVTALTVGVVLLSAANVRERAERERAEENFAEANQQRKLAERNFAMARSAVHDYFITVSEDTLLQQPGMQSLREDLLRQALGYYQTFLDQRQDDPSLRQEVADAHFYAGTIVQTISSPAEALPHLQKGADLVEELLKKSPEDMAIVADYGRALNAIGEVYYRLGKLGEARQHFEHAARVREQVAEADPKNAEAARVYANSVMNSGSMHLALGQREHAVALLERAQMIRMAHVESLERPEPRLQRDLGKGYYQLALIRYQLGDVAAAESNFLAAVENFRRLLQSEPRDMNHQRNLALSLRGVADLKAGEHDSQGAIEYFRQAEEILEELSMRNPDVHIYAAELAGVQINLAIQCRKQKMLDEALHAAGRAVELLRELTQLAETVPAYRLDLGIALREQGQLLAATDDTSGARELLLESKQVLSKLVQENPGSDRYATELGLTVDALAADIEPVKRDNARREEGPE